VTGRKPSKQLCNLFQGVLHLFSPFFRGHIVSTSMKVFSKKLDWISKAIVQLEHSILVKEILCEWVSRRRANYR
jgi:hypothetical protein